MERELPIVKKEEAMKYLKMQKRAARLTGFGIFMIFTSFSCFLLTKHYIYTGTLLVLATVLLVMGRNAMSKNKYLLQERKWEHTGMVLTADELHSQGMNAVNLVTGIMLVLMAPTLILIGMMMGKGNDGTVIGSAFSLIAAGIGTGFLVAYGMTEKAYRKIRKSIG